MLQFAEIVWELTVQNVPNVLPEGSVMEHHFSKLHSFNENVLYSNKTDKLVLTWFKLLDYV